MTKVQVFNLGNPVRRQCAQRQDGVWFERSKREDAPGFNAWKLATFTVRPIHAWYAGQYARLPQQEN